MSGSRELTITQIVSEDSESLDFTTVARNASFTFKASFPSSISPPEHSLQPHTPSCKQLDALPGSSSGELRDGAYHFIGHQGPPIKVAPNVATPSSTLR